MKRLLVSLGLALILSPGLVAFAADPPAAEFTAEQTARVKEILRTRCYECHGGDATNAGIDVLDRRTLLDKKKLVPGKADQSRLFQVVSIEDDAAMPPEGQPRLPQEDIEAIRRWIAAGAPAFPDDVAVPSEEEKDPALQGVVGVDYVFKQILKHVGSLPAKDQPFVRYFSLHHLLTGGATRQELDLHRDALAKAINHLSLETKIVRPEPIDTPTNSLLAVDIRRLGWHKRPFKSEAGGKTATAAVNLFDLALLEYPYAAVHEDSETFDRLAREFLVPANMVRPIPFVRADWFISVATQPPLYEDFLLLPHEQADLEKSLNVDCEANIADGRAKRAGMTVSGVSRNNRVVERHPSPHGSYWKSFDFSTSKGRENMFLDPIHLNAVGGELIFSLPNGLQGYFLATAAGRRINDAPTSIVTDKFAEDKTVRNGLACMRCHDNGIKDFTDNVRPAVEQLPGSGSFSKKETLLLYPPQDEMNSLLAEDTDRFRAALEQALGHEQVTEPLIPVSKRFLEAPIQLRLAAAELGIAESAGLQQLFRTPQFSSLGLVALGSPKGVVRRDTWESFYGHLVRDLGLAVPVFPIDALGTQDFPPSNPPFDVELKTSKKNNVFAPGDNLVLFVKNPTKSDLFIELVGTSARGDKVILAPGGTTVKPGQEFRFPQEGSLTVQGGLGKEQITLFASDKAFPPGQLLKGQGAVDRVVHAFYKLDPQQATISAPFDPARMVKKTIEIETR